jgi:hypothetical protein
MKRSTASVPLALSLAVLAFALVPTAGLAAKGGNGGGGKPSDASLSLVLLDGATEARHLGRVTFEVSTSATDRPYVGVRCWQGPAWVYDGYVGYFEEYMFEEDWFTLDSPYWTAGVDATCTARLFHYDRRGNQKVLATLDFPVAA